VIPLIPCDRLVIIALRQRRARLARYRQIDSYQYEVEDAANWQALEALALAAVETHIGALVENADYPCPPDLAARALWR
jgi:hypothetical protein